MFTHIQIMDMWVTYTKLTPLLSKFYPYLSKFPLQYTKMLIRILLFVHINDIIGDIKTCKIYLFNNKLYLSQLTNNRQLFMIN